jgi:hypothetical protein
MVYNSDNHSLILMISSPEGSVVQQWMEVSLFTIYLTESIFQDMVTVRTMDYETIPSGYIGTFAVTSWLCIEEEMMQSLRNQKHEGKGVFQQRHQSLTEESLIPFFHSKEKKEFKLFYRKEKRILQQSEKKKQSENVSERQLKSRFDDLLPSHATLQELAMILLSQRMKEKQQQQQQSTHSDNDSAFEDEAFNIFLTQLKNQTGEEEERSDKCGSQLSNLPKLFQNSELSSSFLNDFFLSHEGRANQPKKNDLLNAKAFFGERYDALQQQVFLSLQGVRPPTAAVGYLAPTTPRKPKERPHTTKSFRTNKLLSAENTVNHSPLMPATASIPSNQGLPPPSIEDIRKRLISTSLTFGTPLLPSSGDSRPQQQEQQQQLHQRFTRKLSFSMKPATEVFNDDSTVASGQGTVDTEPIRQAEVSNSNKNNDYCFPAIPELPPFPVTKTATVEELEQIAMNKEITLASTAHQAILLIESRRIMQLYFTKKFLQLDILVNVFTDPADAHESLQQTPEIYGLIFISYYDLKFFGIEETLQSLIPSHLNRFHYSIVVYDVSYFDCIIRREDLRLLQQQSAGEEQNNHNNNLEMQLDEEDKKLEEEEEFFLEVLEENGVEDILYPPYTLSAIRSLLFKHQKKVELVLELDLFQTK